MRQQHRKRANTTCCLEFADDEQLSCCYTTESLQASWNPIVYPPSQLGASWNASASGALISGHVTTERSNSLAYLPSEKWEEDPAIDGYDDATCDVSKCFPEEPYLWEVSGYRYKQEGSNTSKEEFILYLKRSHGMWTRDAEFSRRSRRRFAVCFAFLKGIGGRDG